MGLRISVSARALAIRLGLGDLVRDDPPCMGYANACMCPRCDLRSELVARGVKPHEAARSARIANIEADEQAA